MNLRFLLAGLCSLTAYAPIAVADDDGVSSKGGAASTEETDSDSVSDEPATESSSSDRLKWKWFGIGFSGRRGPISGSAGWWGDVLISARTGFSGSVGLRFELGGGIGRLEHSTDLPLSTLSEAPVVSNTEYMDVYSGLFRIALEIPEDPLVLRIGPVAGAGVGKYHSSVSSCGDDDWSRSIFGGGVDGSVGLGDPVFLEPFVRFDVLYLANPECVEGPRVTATSSTLQQPGLRYSDNVGLFVGAGIMLGL